MSFARKTAWVLVSVPLIFIVLLVVLRLLAPLLIERGIVNWFDQQQLSATVEAVDIDLGDGSFSISALAVNNKGQQVLNLDRISTSWSWPALLDSRLWIRSIKVDGLVFAINQLSDDKLIVAGIDIASLAEPSADASPAEKQAPLEWIFSLDQIQLTNFDICYQQQDIHDYCSEFNQLNWQGKFELDLARLDEAALPLSSRGRLQLEAFEVTNNQLGRALIKFSNLDIHDLEIETPEAISINRFALTSLSLLGRQADELAQQVTAFDEISMTYIKLDALNNLSVKDLTVKEHQALLIKRADNRMEIDEWLPSSKSASADEPAKTDGESFQFAIEKFTYETGKSIQYQDNSLDKPFIVDLNNIDLTVENLDSKQPEQDSKVKYSAQYADHGKITLEGTARPLSDKPSFNLPGKIAGLDLRDLSPFTNDAIGHAIKSGQLDADLKLNAEQNILDSSVDLKLYHFELTAKNPEAEAKIDADFGYPLNSSLSLLKDSDNTIELSIPVTGDLDNPDFDTKDVIRSATSNAITSAIISYYTPFGLVMAVEGLIDLATALNFEPVEFAAGESTLASSQHESLKKLIQLMNEKPGIHLTLCAFSNTADRHIVLPETATVAIDQLKLQPEQTSQLIELGEARAKTVKQFLVDQNIEASRLILCTSEHTEGEGLSGVEISI